MHSRNTICCCHAPYCPREVRSCNYQYFMPSASSLPALEEGSTLGVEPDLSPRPVQLLELLLIRALAHACSAQARLLPHTKVGGGHGAMPSPDYPLACSCCGLAPGTGMPLPPPLGLTPPADRAPPKDRMEGMRLPALGKGEQVGREVQGAGTRR